MNRKTFLAALLAGLQKSDIKRREPAPRMLQGIAKGASRFELAQELANGHAQRSPGRVPLQDLEGADQADARRGDLRELMK